MRVIVAAMQYMVVGADGKEYGPVDFATLTGWAEQRRVTPTTQIRDVLSGQVMPASAVSGLFPDAAVAMPPAGTPMNAPPPTYSPPTTPPPGNWSQPPTDNYRPSAQYSGNAGSNSGTEGSGVLWRSLIYSALAIVLFFAIGGFGLIFGGYAVYYAFQARSHGNKYGTIAIVFSLVALVAIVIGWIIRLQTRAV